ncbi:MAG: hypothetical protein LBS98_07155, partial [Coriobacteriales bacterium]|nr:hypothetical protein [Coriobacteriales bacterium]
MVDSKGSGGKQVGAGGASHATKAQRMNHRKKRNFFSKLLSVVLAINMALMFALPATIFADNSAGGAGDDYVAAPSAGDVVYVDPGSSGSTAGAVSGDTASDPSGGSGSSGSAAGDSSGQAVTIEQPSASSGGSSGAPSGTSGDAAVNPTDDAAPITTFDGDESLAGGFSTLDVGDVEVTDWAGFVTAWRDPATVRIILKNSITHPAGSATGVRLSYGFPRTTNIEITGD